MRTILLPACCLIVGALCAADSEPQHKVILDTDIGDDVDDAYALALLTSLPNARILGVTTAFGQTAERAEVAAKLLSVIGRKDIPVYAGRRGAAEIRRQYDWARGFRAGAIKKQSAVAFMRSQILRNPGEVTLIAVGPLTNLGDLLTQHPEVKAKIKRIVIMGGAVYAGYSNQGPPIPEWNIKCDPQAAKVVFSSGVPLTMAGLEATSMMQLDEERQKRLFAAGKPLTDPLAALTNLWGNKIPVLFDPVAVAFALGHRFAESEYVGVNVETDGLTKLTSGTPNATVLVKPRKDAFLDWYVDTVAGSLKK